MAREGDVYATHLSLSGRDPHLKRTTPGRTAVGALMDIAVVAGILSFCIVGILIGVPLLRAWRRRRNHW